MVFIYLENVAYYKAPWYVYIVKLKLRNKWVFKVINDKFEMRRMGGKVSEITYDLSVIVDLHQVLVFCPYMFSLVMKKQNMYLLEYVLYYV
jgi:hypothetical protein